MLFGRVEHTLPGHLEVGLWGFDMDWPHDVIEREDCPSNNWRDADPFRCLVEMRMACFRRYQRK